MNIKLFSLLSLLLLPAIGIAAERTISAGDISAQDGDTVLILINDKNERIQLTGIDAPEDVDNPKLQLDLKRTALDKSQLLKIGRIATEQLRFLLQTHPPYVLYYNPHQHDRYGRIPGKIVNAAGASIAAQMIANGYAIVNRRGAPTSLIDRLLPLQQSAMRKKRGLWGLYGNITRRWADIKQH